jgi:hypothetical protein
MAGAWRSLRYDMGRRPSEPPAGGPDVTSTGMNTFGQQWDFGSEPIEMPVAGRPPAPRRPPRPVALVSAFGLLTVLGAAGAYLVVVNGLVPLRDETPAAAGTFPPAAPAATADSGIGPSTLRPRPRLTSPAPVVPGAVELPVASDDRPAPLPPAPRHANPVRTVTPAHRECGCDKPPVPTPTAPASAPSPTPSAPASASGSPSVSPTSPDTSGSPTGSPEPSTGWKAGHHRPTH